MNTWEIERRATRDFLFFVNRARKMPDYYTQKEKELARNTASMINDIYCANLEFLRGAYYQDGLSGVPWCISILQDGCIAELTASAKKGWQGKRTFDMHKISKEEILEYLRCLSAATGKD